MKELLDAIRDALDCATDSELAEALGVGASRICNYRKGRALPNAWMTRRIAAVLKTQAADVMLHIRRKKEARRATKEARATGRRALPEAPQG